MLLSLATSVGSAFFTRGAGLKEEPLAGCPLPAGLRSINEGEVTVTVNEVLNAYGDAWNEADGDARRAQLRQSLTDDVVYCDPTIDVVGPDALAEHIGQTRRDFGGFRIQRTSGFEEHHGYGRFAWQMTSDAGELIVEGFDVVRVAPDGRFQSIVGFFGPFPER